MCDKQNHGQTQQQKGTTELPPLHFSIFNQNINPILPKKGIRKLEGFEELYEGLDRVLTKLRAYTKHSYPFLTRVRKSDAPNYYDVVKNPMDLSLVGKKIKKLEYFSKRQFREDLDLMFANCELYNSPGSIYLHHAVKLNKKATELLAQLSDIDFTEAALALKESSLTSPPPSSPKASSTSPLLSSFLSSFLFPFLFPLSSFLSSFLISSLFLFPLSYPLSFPPKASSTSPLLFSSLSSFLFLISPLSSLLLSPLHFPFPLPFFILSPLFLMFFPTSFFSPLSLFHFSSASLSFCPFLSSLPISLSTATSISWFLVIKVVQRISFCEMKQHFRSAS